MENIPQIKTFEFKSRWIWYRFSSLLLMVIIIFFFAYESREEISNYFSDWNLPAIVVIGLVAYLVILTTEDIAWFLFGRLNLLIDTKSLVVKQDFGLWSKRKTFDLGKISNMETLSNVKSYPWFKLGIFLWLYIYDKKLLSFEYNGKQVFIGMDTSNFDADTIKKIILAKKK